MMAKIKKETKKYPAGTMLAVDLYNNGNFFEAELKNYRTDKRNKDEVWAYVKYHDDEETEGWIDLNIIQVIELSQDNILTLEDCAAENLTDDEKGFLGRRLTVLWLDDARYTGTVTKILKDDNEFVFIKYDNGDKCWYNLSPEYEQESQYDESENTTNKRTTRKSETKSSTTVKKEEESSTSNKSNADADFDMSRKNLEKKYPVGCTISVDVYHDEHYHEATVKKYLLNANKRQQAKGEHWVYIEFFDKARTKQWIDLGCIKVIRMTPEKTLRLDQLKPGDDKGFLGRRIVVMWQDGNKYRGLATRSAKNNKHFVFVEYDDGDECWCDLKRESEWSFDGDGSLGSDDDDDNSSDESEEEENTRAKTKRKGNAEGQDRSTKRARRSREESFDF